MQEFSTQDRVWRMGQTHADECHGKIIIIPRAYLKPPREHHKRKTDQRRNQRSHTKPHRLSSDASLTSSDLQRVRHLGIKVNNIRVSMAHARSQKHTHKYNSLLVTWGEVRAPAELAATTGRKATMTVQVPIMMPRCCLCYR